MDTHTDITAPPRRASEAETTAPTRQEILYAYRQWLDMEGRMLGFEMFPECGASAGCFIPQNTLANNYHMPLDRHWDDVAKPSTRAELVLRLVGALPVSEASR